jgi:WD40 repeat protein
MTDQAAEQPHRSQRPETPYVGLVPYGEEDASLFFGRDAEKRVVIGNLRASRLTILYGASGVGKTSLLRAGVLHDLRAEMLAAAPQESERASFAICAFANWRDDPLGELMATIHAAAVDALGGRKLPPWQPGEPVVPALREWMTRVRTLLVVLDQFEDYFLYHADEGGDEAFAGAFPAIVNDANLRVNTLVSIREDAWAKLDRFEGRIPQLFRNYIRVDHLNRAAATEAVERPVEEWNRRLGSGEQHYELEPGLVDAVIAAAAGGGLAQPVAPTEPTHDREASDGIEAPFLQLVMQRLWRETIAPGSHVVTLATLEQLGGARRIVENHLREALGALSASQQEVAADAFRFLVTRSKTKVAHSAADLAEWTKRPEPEVSAVLEELCRREHGRILRRVPPPGGAAMRFELFHDVLAEPVLEWRRDFEEAEARSAAIRRFVRVGSVLLALVGLFAALGIWALVQRSDAKRATRSATSVVLATAAERQLPSHLDRSLLLGLESYRASRRAEAENAMVDALAARAQLGFAGILRAGDRVRSMAFSPDGRLLATAGLDGTLRIWDVQQRALLGEPLAEDTGMVWGLAFSPDGHRLAVAGRDGTVRLWDALRRTQLAVLHDRGGGVLTVAFSPDGRLLASAGDGGAITLRDAHSLVHVNSLRAREASRIVAMTFVLGGDSLAAAGDDGIVRVWDVRARELQGKLPDKDSSAVLSVAFSRNGNMLAVGRDDGAVRLWNLRTQRPLGSPLNAGVGPVWGVAFSPDGRTLASSGDTDYTVRLWDVHSRAPLRRLRGHTDRVINVAFSPDGRTLASSGYDGTVLIWDVRGGQPPLHVIRAHDDRVVAVAFSPDGRTLASAGDGTLGVWDTASGRSLRPFASGEDASESIAFSPDGRLLAAGSDDGLVRLWRVRDRRLLGKPLRSGEGAVFSLAFSPDGRLLAAGGHDGAVQLWDVEKRRRAGPPLVGRTRDVQGVAFSPDGRLLATAASADFAGAVRIWDVRSHELRAGPPLTRDDWPSSLAFSRDARTLAFGEVRGWIRLWDVRRRMWLGQPLHAGTKTIEDAAFSPDGRTLATAGDDGSVRLWDVERRRQLGSTLREGGGAVYDVAFSPDGRTVASANQDGTVRLWRDILWRNPRELRASVCRLVVGELTKNEWAELVSAVPYRSSCG